MFQLDYAGYAFPVEGLGPGRRLVIWVRGCSRRCAGCMTPELWQSASPTPVTDIANELLPFLQKVDGLTISGGEPFEQPDALCALLDSLRRENNVETLLYSGYLLEEISSGDQAARELLSRLDLLIDGPYIASCSNVLQWRGSDNQRLHLLSTRAQHFAEEQNKPMADPRPLQLQMLSAASCRIIGIPRRGDVDALLAQGIKLRSEW